MSVSCVLTTCSNKAAAGVGGCVFQNKAAACIDKPSRYDQLHHNNTFKMRSFSAPAAKMVVSDGISYVGSRGFSIKSNYTYYSSGNNNNNNNYNYNYTNNNERISVVDSCLVIPPSETTPKGAKKKKVRAIIKFLGGAFIGAIPHVSYRYLLELLANEGFLVVCVPYNVTFDHAQATNQVYQRFNSCLDTLFTSGLPLANLSPSQILQLPLFSVGHSNGALLQVLEGSYFSENIPKANAIISFNNRPATEAVPYFEQLGPLVSQMMPIVEESPVLSVARSISDDAWKMFLGTAGTMMRDNQEVLDSFTQFVDQLPLVLNQVTEGVSEFKPTPSENLDCFQCSYNVQHTLLVKFKVDAIDQTDLLEDALKKRLDAIDGMLEKVELSGNHITPCIQEAKWPVGSSYTPADAIAQGLRSVSLSDTRVLLRTISDWFRQFEN